jgi:hypothetical protein
MSSEIGGNGYLVTASWRKLTDSWERVDWFFSVWREIANQRRCLFINGIRRFGTVRGDKVALQRAYDDACRARTILFG